MFTGKLDENGIPNRGKMVLSGGILYKGQLNNLFEPVSERDSLMVLHFPENDMLRDKCEGPLDRNFKPLKEGMIVNLKNGDVFTGVLDEQYKPVKGMQHIITKKNGEIYQGEVDENFFPTGSGMVIPEGGDAKKIVKSAAQVAEEGAKQALEQAKQLFGRIWR